MKILAAVSLALVASSAAALPPLTRAEAAVCMRDLHDVQQRNATLTAESQRLGREAADIQDAERVLEQLQARVDADRAALTVLKERAEKEKTLEGQLRTRTDFDIAREAFEVQLKRYNDGVRAQQARREPYNRDARQLNAQIAVLDADSQEIDARCAGRRVQP